MRGLVLSLLLAPLVGLASPEATVRASEKLRDVAQIAVDQTRQGGANDREVTLRLIELLKIRERDLNQRWAWLMRSVEKPRFEGNRQNLLVGIKELRRTSSRLVQVGQSREPSAGMMEADGALRTALDDLSER